MINLYYQDPLYINSYSLHEAILEIISKSNYGAGTYAFVSSEGVSLLFEDIKFIEFFDKNYKFDLLVGMDEVTNKKTLLLLESLKNKYLGSFKVQAFYNTTKNSLYHPKVSWFKTEEGNGYLIVGSGNLTASGLRRNREIFSIIELEQDKISEIEAEWKKWYDFNRENIKEISEEEVLKKAEKNGLIFRKKEMILEDNSKENISEEASELEREEIVIEKSEWSIEKQDNVNQLFLTEIPRASTRWNQVNFKKEIFYNYFGVSKEENKQFRVLFKEIKENQLSKIETRPGVTVRSHNYRFELDAAKDKDYPSGNNRPIGIFFKVATRMFLYLILMPEDDLYNSIKIFLGNNTQVTRPDRMKDYQGKISDIWDIIKDTFIAEFIK